MPDPGYETRDTNTRGVWFFAAGLAVCLGIIFLAIGGFMHWLAVHPASTVSASRISAPFQNPASPALQVHPPADLAAYQAREHRILDACEWIDRKAGVVRIPIERAMALVVERGVNAGPGQPPPRALTPLEMQQQKAKETPP